MKKVWILEKFQTRAEMDEELKGYEEMLESAKKENDNEEVLMMEKVVAKLKTRMEENPDGYWSGWEGKTIYKQFCEVAKDAIRRAKKDDKFRVVEGEIADNAKYWPGYKFVKENEGVLRYLMATK